MKIEKKRGEDTDFVFEWFTLRGKCTLNQNLAYFVWDLKTISKLSTLFNNNTNNISILKQVV